MLNRKHFNLRPLAPAKPTDYEVRIALACRDHQAGIPNPATAVLLLAGRRAVARVDAADYERTAQYRWQLKKNGMYYYAAAKSCGTEILLHRLVLPVEKPIRFLDGNPLNCTRANLVVCGFDPAAAQTRLFKPVKAVKNDFRSEVGNA